MRISGKEKYIAVIAVVILLAAVVSVSAALLIHETKVDSEVVFGTIEAGATDFLLEHSAEMKFSKAGDRAEIKVIVRSGAVEPLKYNYEVSVLTGYELAKAVLVYRNGEFLSVLSGNQSLSGNFTSDDKFIAPFDGTSKDEIEDVFEFVLHNGASGSYSDNRTCTVNIKMTAETVDYTKNIFVSDMSELREAIGDVNNAVNDNTKTIRLLKDITLDKDYVVSNSADIDFLKGKILFNGFKLRLESASAESTVKFSSTRKTYIGADGNEKGILLNSLLMAVEITPEAREIAKTVETVSYNEKTADKIKYNHALSVAGNGIESGAGYDLLGVTAEIYGDGGIEASGDSTDVYAVNGRYIECAASVLTRNAAVSVGGKTLNFKVYGASESKYADIIDEALIHLSSVTADKDKELNYDVFLPVSIPQSNMSIEWCSDRPDVMSSAGVISQDGDGYVTLSAVIRINQDVVLREFTFLIYKQNNQMRFDYLVARIGEKELSALYDASEPQGSYFVLPVVDGGSPDDYRVMYDMRNIGLKSLSYQIDSVSDYLGIANGNKITLNEPTFDTYVNIVIRGVFKNEPGKIYEGYINVNIKTVDNTELHRQILDYLQGILDKTDILQNILDTRRASGTANEKGDFILPGKYKAYSINYEITAASNGAISSITAREGADGIEYLFHVNAEAFENVDKRIAFNAIIEISEPDADSLTATVSPLYVMTPPALHCAKGDNDGDIIDADLFYAVKQQIAEAMAGDEGVPIYNGIITDEYRAALENNYILLHDAARLKRLYLIGGDNTYTANMKTLDSENGKYFYNIKSGSMNDFGALKYFDLTTLIIRSKGVDIMSEGVADDFLGFAVGVFDNVTEFALDGCGLTSGDDVRNWNKLKYLDLKGNVALNGFDWLTVLNVRELSYLNLSGTLFDNIQILTVIYYRYGKANGGLKPAYYYGNGVLYEPAESEMQQKLIHYLYSLNDINNFNSEFVQLKQSVIGDNGEILTIEWNLGESSSIYVRLNNDVEGILRLENLNSAANNESVIIELTATVSCDDGAGNTIAADRVFRIAVSNYAS